QLGPDADAALGRLLSDADHRVRSRAAVALTAGPRNQAVAVCAPLLRYAASGNAGDAAARALADRSDAADVLLSALGNDDPRVRRRAASVLPGSAPSDAALVAALDTAARSESDPDVLAELLLALGRSGRPEAAAVLLHTLAAGAPFARAHAAW